MFGGQSASNRRFRAGPRESEACRLNPVALKARERTWGGEANVSAGGPSLLLVGADHVRRDKHALGTPSGLPGVGIPVYAGAALARESMPGVRSTRSIRQRNPDHDTAHGVPKFEVVAGTVLMGVVARHAGG